MHKKKLSNKTKIIIAFAVLAATAVIYFALQQLPSTAPTGGGMIIKTPSTQIGGNTANAE